MPPRICTKYGYSKLESIKTKRELSALKSDYALMAEALMSAMMELEDAKKAVTYHRVSKDLRGER